jgi:hypothetical protein
MEAKYPLPNSAPQIGFSEAAWTHLVISTAAYGAARASLLDI